MDMSDNERVTFMSKRLKNELPYPENLPPLPLLLCAACGPLGKSHARAAGVSCEGVEGIVCEKALYRVAEPVDLLTLHRYVAQLPPLRAAVRAVCEKRYSQFRSKPPHRRDDEDCRQQLALLVRGALLLDDASWFHELFEKRVERRGFCLFREGISTSGFWRTVLGRDMVGSELVPEGAAREEIMRLEAEWYAFSASPAGRARGKGACGAPQQEALEVLAALRAADAVALKALADKGSRLAVAAGMMLEGQWKAASIVFEEELGWTVAELEEVTVRHALPLLLYASLCVLLGKGKVRSLDAWLRTLQEKCRVMEKSDFLKPLVDEWLVFAEHLRLADGLLNRKVTMASHISSCNALGSMPLALACPLLPDYVLKKLPADLLARAVDILAKEGQVLLAAYGAAGLQAVELSPQWGRRMDEVMAMAEGVQLPAMEGGGAAESLLASLEDTAEREGGLIWNVPPERGQLPQVSVQRRKNYLLLKVPDDMALLRGNYLSCFWRGTVVDTLRRYARCGCVMLDARHAARLMRLSLGLLHHVEMTGSLLPPGGQVVPAEPHVVAEMAMLRAGRVSVRMRMRLLPGATPLVIPGWGLEDALVELSGRHLVVRRQLAAEEELAKSALKRLGLGRKTERSLMGQGCIVLDDVAAAMEFLQACKGAELPVCWRGERHLRLYRPARALKLNLGDLQRDWLELGAELEVDEGKVLELSVLLEAFANRCRNMLQVGQDEYVMLDGNLERQLALLELIWQKKGKRRGLHRSALPLLEALARADGGAQAPCEPAPLPVPVALNAQLRPYQKEGFEWLASRATMGVGAFLADDMGLGKTVQMLALLLHEAARPKSGVSMVVAPVSLLGNWGDEAARFAPTLPVITYDSRRPEMLNSLPNGTIVLVSYGQLAANTEPFLARKWNVVVLDEAQAIKNPDSQRARAVCSLRARVRFCLTGTPIENSLLDLWSGMNFLNHGLFGAREAFMRRFARLEEKDRTLLRQVLSPLVLRRTKGEVLKQLPALTETVEWVEFSTKERALYESIRRAAVKKLHSGETGGGIALLAELTRLRRACCHGQLALDSFAGNSAKLETMERLVLELKSEQRRVLIFSQFTDVLDLAEPVLNRAGITHLRLDGSTPASRRSALVRRFQAGEADVFLISLKAGGFGLNLTAADYVLLLDPWWNPAVEDQAASRAHRMGQQSPVTVCRLVVRDTVEERILQMHQDKKELAESILSPGGQGVTLDVLRSLLGNEDRQQGKRG